jgi:hypothetical protein
LALRLLVDEDTQARTLVRLLETAGHDVTTVNAESLQGLDDGAVLRLAAVSGRVLLTRNAADFLALHQADPAHAGIVAIYQDADPMKNMTYAEIVRALGNLDSSGIPVVGVFNVLNAFRW